MDSPVLLFQTPNPTGAWESCINQSLGWALTSVRAQQEEWKARDHKTVCGLSRFISSQGQGEKMLVLGRQIHLKRMDKLVEVCMSACSERRRLREAGPTGGYWMSCPLISTIQEGWGMLMSQTLIRFGKISL